MNIYERMEAMGVDMKGSPRVSALDNRQIPSEIDLSGFLEIREEDGILHPYLKLDGDNQKLLQMVSDIKNHLARLKAEESSRRNEPISFE